MEKIIVTISKIIFFKFKFVGLNGVKYELLRKIETDILLGCFEFGVLWFRTHANWPGICNYGPFTGGRLHLIYNPGRFTSFLS